MAILITDKDHFDSELENAGATLVLVDFFATWCGPCKRIAPDLEAIAKEKAGTLVVLKVDIDKCEGLAQDYSISSMPTFVFIKSKAEVHRFSGANLENLKKSIEEQQ